MYKHEYSLQNEDTDTGTKLLTKLRSWFKFTTYVLNGEVTTLGCVTLVAPGPESISRMGWDPCFLVFGGEPAED